MAARPWLGCAPIDLRAVDARLWLAWNDAGLCRLTWAAPGTPAEAAFGVAEVPERPLPEPYAGVLSEYFAGGQADPAQLPVDLVGTPFQARVWAALREVPRGSVRTYQGIASDVGSPRAMRAVGSANGKNPLPVVVPCHRVIEAGMRLGGYSGGLHLKRFLLELEGVRIVGDEVKPGQLTLL